MMIDLYIQDTGFNLLAVVDDASEILWSTRYYAIGSFEFTLYANSPNTRHIKAAHYVKRMDDDRPGIIEKVVIKADIENGDYYVISGRLLPSILDRRIVWYQTTLTNVTAEDAIRQFIYDNAIHDPIRPNRNIPSLILGPRQGFTETVTIQRTGTALDELTEELCKTYGYGFGISLNPEKQFVFELYKGADRSYGQRVNPYVVFSEDFDNLIPVEYTYSLEGYKNVNLVAGEGEGLDRRTAAAGQDMFPIEVNGKQEWEVNVSGLERRERYTDVRDASSNDGSISAADYEQQLITRGLEGIGGITEAFDADVELKNTYVYRKDFDVGDIVTVESRRWGVYTNSRLVEVTESFSEEGYKLVPAFAD